MDAGVRGFAEDLHVPAFGAGGADGDFPRMPPIDIEADCRVAKVRKLDKASAPQTAFFANRKQQRQRRMRELLCQQVCDQIYQARTSGTVVAAQCRGPIRNDAIAFPRRLGASTQGHRVEMRREQPARSRHGSREIDEEIAGLRRQRNARVRVIEADAASWYAGIAQRIDDDLADLLFLTSDSFDGEELHQQIDSIVRIEIQPHRFALVMPGEGKPPAAARTESAFCPLLWRHDNCSILWQYRDSGGRPACSAALPCGNFISIQFVPQRSSPRRGCALNARSRERQASRYNENNGARSGK